jgi:hypothetical protein
MEDISCKAALEPIEMKEVQSLRKKAAANKTTNDYAIRRKRTRVAKIIIAVRATSPSATSPEIPILRILDKNPKNGVRTRSVLREVSSGVWYPKLNDDDRRARYPASKKKIVESIIKFAKKNLVLKGEVHPVNKDQPLGIWRITQTGQARSAMEWHDWSPRYATHEDAILIEEEKENGVDVE